MVEAGQAFAYRQYHSGCELLPLQRNRLLRPAQERLT